MAQHIVSIIVVRACSLNKTIALIFLQILCNVPTIISAETILSVLSIPCFLKLQFANV